MLKKLYIIIFLLLLNNFVIGQYKVNLLIVHDTIQINPIELTKINVRFERIIKDFIKKIKKKNIFLSTKKNVLVIRIEDDYFYCPSDEVRREKYKNFKNENFGQSTGFDITCRFIKKNTVVLSREDVFKGKLFYYKYKNLDVIFVTDLDISFPNENTQKTIICISKHHKIVLDDNGKYYDYEILVVKIPEPEKYENFSLQYKLLNHGVFRILYKTLFYDESLIRD